MIDYFSLAVSHGLMLLAAWHLMFRPDLDDDDAQMGDAEFDMLGRPIGKADAETETHA